MTTNSQSESNSGASCQAGRVYVELGKVAGVQAAARAVQAGASADRLTYLFSVRLAPKMWDVAHAVGLSRKLLKELKGKAFFEYREGQDEKIDTEGALGELVIGQLLGRAKGCELAPLVDHKPVKAQDIKLGALSLDAKTFGEGRALCVINQKAHQEKAPDAYLALKIERGDVLDVLVVSSGSVQGWELTTAIRGRALPPERYYYQARLPKLEPLPELVEA